MALRSVIDIELNGVDQFRKFADVFARYQDMLKATPAAWRKVGDEIDAVMDKTAEGTEKVADAAGKANVSFRQTFVAISGQAAQISKVATATGTAGRFASAQASAWHGMARDARSFAGHISDATRSLLRWGALTGLISGILGGGGLFGIDRLATSAASQRRSSSGLGVTPGEEKAFNLNYNRLVDSEAVLSAVNTGKLNLANSRPLYSLGFNEQDIKGKDTAQLSADYIDALKRLVDQTEDRMLGSLIEPYGLKETGFDESGLKRLKDRPASEIAQYRSDFQENAKTLDLKSDQQKAWEDFKVQLSRAGASIENTFIRGLTPLAPALGALSDAFTKAISAFLENKQVGEWITALAGALKGFADEIAKPEFATKIETFVTDVGRLATAIGDAFTAVVGWVNWFRGGSGSSSSGSDPTADHGKEPQQGLGDWMKDRWYNGPVRDKQLGGEPRQSSWGDSLKGSSESKPIPDQNTRQATYARLEGQQGLPRGLLSAVERQESGGMDVTSPVGAKGYFQFMDPTAARFHVNPHDEADSARGSSEYLGWLSNRYHNDLAKTLAGYNAGEGRVDQSVKQYGDQWREHLPSETKDYVSSVERKMSRQESANRQIQVNLQVYNATAGNAIVSASQLMPQ